MKLIQIFLVVFASSILVVGCNSAPSTEGTQPGECSDGADNDADGDFDCNDSDCAGAPVCQNTAKTSTKNTQAVSSKAVLEDKKGVPTELFGFTLGKVYNLGGLNLDNVGEFPIKKFTGMQGEHLFFQPIKHDEIFEYKELRKKPSDKYFKTTFAVYTIPLIPESVTSMEELEKLEVDKFEIGSIQWADNKKDEQAGYWWVDDLCATMSAGLNVKAAINKDYLKLRYECVFKEKERDLVIKNIGDRVIFKLEFNRKIGRGKINARSDFIRRLKAKRILE